MTDGINRTRMANTVIVTEKEHGKGEEVFNRAGQYEIVRGPAEEAALSRAVKERQARAVVIGIERYTGPLYHALNEVSSGRGALIARFGVGHDGVDKALASENGIVVCNTPGVLEISVAEHTLWLMGNLARHISQLETRLRVGEFAGETGTELHGKRLGILGFGRIGRRVAAMAHFGLGMTVCAADALGLEQMEAKLKRGFKEIQTVYGLEYYTNDCDRLFGECDWLSLHMPATPANRHFLNTARLSLMKSTAMMVNTARGSLVDEAALFDALAGGRLAGAALDVFENEPYQPVAPHKDLRQLSNVVLTPHAASNTREANRRMAEACLANVKHFFTGDFRRLSKVNA